MNLRAVNQVTSAALILTSIALVAIVFWGLSQLQATYKLAQSYYQFRESLSGDWRSQIEDYLNSGDSVKLDAAVQKLDAITDSQLRDMPVAIQEQLAPRFVSLKQALDVDLRAAGKLAGDPQALLSNDEGELRGKLALLSELAVSKKASNPALTIAYVTTIAEMQDLLVQTVHGRLRYFIHARAESANGITERVNQLKAKQQLLANYASLQIIAKNDASNFDQLGADTTENEEKSVEVRRDIASVINRYANDMQRTSDMLIAAGKAKEKVRYQLHELLTILSARESDIAAHQSSIRVKVKVALLTLTALVLAVCGVLFFLQFRLSVVARAVGEHQKKLAAGDLRETFKLHSHIDEVNELTQSTATLQLSLMTLSEGLNERGEQVALASQQILQSSKALQSSLQTQLDHSHQASNAIGDMTDASNRVSDEVSAVVTATNAANITLGSGTRIVERLVDSVTTLTDEVTDTLSALSELQHHTSSIQAFVGNIQSIADQTNLLALNAAIEAARAGQLGRGFAVVADEVRTLAQRSSTATIEIERLIDKVNSSTGQLGKIMQKQMRSAQQTAEEIQAAGASYRDLEGGVAKIRGAVSDIAERTEQQKRAAQSFSDFINDTVIAARESNSRSQESLSISVQLDQIAGQVRALAQQFVT